MFDDESILTQKLKPMINYKNKFSVLIPGEDVEEIKGGALYKTVYAILPLLPIILLIGSFAVQKITGAQIDISVEVATLFSFIVAIICEIIRKRNAGETLKETEAFFKGMGGSMPIVALLVAGTVFGTGLKSIGLITALQSAMTGLSGGKEGGKAENVRLCAVERQRWRR